MAIIHGARGIGYFCHVFKPKFIEAGLLAGRAMIKMVHSVNDRIMSLAPVLNTRTVKNGAVNTGKIQVDTMVKRKDGYTYIFAVSMRSGSTSNIFKLRDFKGISSIEVIGENRLLPVKDGLFEDYLNDYDVHIYKIRN